MVSSHCVHVSRSCPGSSISRPRWPARRSESLIPWSYAPSSAIRIPMSEGSGTPPWPLVPSSFWLIYTIFTVPPRVYPVPSFIVTSLPFAGFALRASMCAPRDMLHPCAPCGMLHRDWMIHCIVTSAQDAAALMPTTPSPRPNSSIRPTTPHLFHLHPSVQPHLTLSTFIHPSSHTSPCPLSTMRPTTLAQARPVTPAPHAVRCDLFR